MNIVTFDPIPNKVYLIHQAFKTQFKSIVTEKTKELLFFETKSDIFSIVLGNNLLPNDEDHWHYINTNNNINFQPYTMTTVCPFKWYLLNDETTNRIMELLNIFQAPKYDKKDLNLIIFYKEYVYYKEPKIKCFMYVASFMLTTQDWKNK